MKYPMETLIPCNKCDGTACLFKTKIQDITWWRCECSHCGQNLSHQHSWTWKSALSSWYSKEYPGFLIVMGERSL